MNCGYSLAHNNYTTDGVCPILPPSRDPAFRVAFANGCDHPLLPLRPCAAPTPAGAVEPGPERLFDPPAQAVVWRRFPKYTSGQQHEERTTWLGARGKAGRVDCAKCFAFHADGAQFRTYARMLQRQLSIPLGGPRVRTVLDLGAGSGGLLAVLQADYSVQGVGVTMSTDSTPMLEAMAARGVVGLRLSLSKPMPFGDGAFDLLHSRMSGLRFVGQGRRSYYGKLRKLRDVTYEWDRLVRAGGYLVQTGWKLATVWGGYSAQSKMRTRLMDGLTSLDAAADEETWLNRAAGLVPAAGDGTSADGAAAATAPPPHFESDDEVFNATVAFFRAQAAHLQWREIFFSHRSGHIDCAYQKPLRRLGLDPTTAPKVA